MHQYGIPQYLLNAIANIYQDTPYTFANVTFRTCMGLKQGCPLSPLLFAIYIADMEKVLRNGTGGAGGVVVGRVKFFMLAYADDMVILAERPTDLQEMLNILQRYAKRNDLVINAAKSKVMRFSGNGHLSKRNWTYGNEELEEVKSFVYLGFTFTSSGRHKKHIEGLASSGKRRVASVWSIAEKNFTENFIIRRQMFYSLVRPAFTYGCEIFGYEECEELERVQRMYFRWTLGVAPWTKKHLLYHETNTEPLKITLGLRAMSYEERSLNSPCLLFRECIKLTHESTPEQSTDVRRLFLPTSGRERESDCGRERRRTCHGRNLSYKHKESLRYQRTKYNQSFSRLGDRHKNP